MLVIGHPEADEISDAVAAPWPHAPSQMRHRLTSLHSLLLAQSLPGLRLLRSGA
jgi:hypothetical protein